MIQLAFSFQLTASELKDKIGNLKKVWKQWKVAEMHECSGLTWNAEFHRVIWDDDLWKVWVMEHPDSSCLRDRVKGGVAQTWVEPARALIDGILERQNSAWTVRGESMNDGLTRKNDGNEGGAVEESEGEHAHEIGEGTHDASIPVQEPSPYDVANQGGTQVHPHHEGAQNVAPRSREVTGAAALARRLNARREKKHKDSRATYGVLVKLSEQIRDATRVAADVPQLTHKVIS